MKRPKPLVLIILDGWGYRAESKANAIALARKPNYDRLLREYPNTLIQTSGHYVGLPDGQMGNSEVGHLNIGAGRIVHMDSTRIELMIQNGEFFSHPVLLAAMKNARSGGRRLHLFGLLSDGGVHSYQTHLYALLKMAKQNGVDRVFVHAFMDGRDTLPTNGAGYLEQLQQKMREYNTGKIASVNGRYYAMLWTIFVILLVLWLLGLVSSYTLGGFIHILLVVAVVVLLIQLFSGRRPAL